MPRLHLHLLAHEDGTKDLRLEPGPQEVPVEHIRLRLSEDTRKLNAPHVVALAESIAVLGLLEPLVLDRKGRLLAGAHRLAALQLLAVEDDDQRTSDFMARIDTTEFSKDSKEQGGTKLCRELIERVGHLSLARSHACPSRSAPVLVADVSDAAKDSEQRRLAIEVAENSVRRPYSAEEIRKLAVRLKDAGYPCAEGKPPEKDKGKPRLISVLGAAVGRSRRTIERFISNEPANKKSDWENARQTFFRAARRLQTEGKGQRREDDRKLLTAVGKILSAADRDGSG